MDRDFDTDDDPDYEADYAVGDEADDGPPTNLHDFYLGTLVIPVMLAGFVGLLVGYAFGWAAGVWTFLLAAAVPCGNVIFTAVHYLCWGWWLGRWLQEAPPGDDEP